MSDLFKSAFGYFNNSNSPGYDNEFVGQTVEIGSVKLNVKRVIAEGGFAFVYVVQDPNTGKLYALKRLLASDQETSKNVLEEINLLKKLSGHSNIIQYLAAASIDKSEASHGSNEYLLLTELCEGGNLVDCLNSRTLSLPPDVVCRIFWQTCKAVQHMHSQVPPVIHRDLKIENLLISSDGVIKLCDFGSCTLKVHKPESHWSAGQRSLLEDDMARFTTPMYRAPEMVDTWSDHAIGPPADIWALGCILYTLCFLSHPFSDSAKLKILNANYTIPSGDARFCPFHDIIRGCLKANPEHRLNISDILERLAAITESLGYDMKEPLRLEGKSVSVSANHSASAAATADSKAPPPRPAQPSRPSPTSTPPSNPPQRPEQPQSCRASQPRNEPSSQTRYPPNQPKTDAGLFSSIKGGAGSFLKNLKDTSSKVMQTVQQTMARTELDISYISSRILVMPFPADGIESAYRSNSIDDVRALLEVRHPGGRYSVYNLSGRSYPPTRLGSGRVVDCPFGGFRKVPPLHIVYNLCADIMSFLERDQRHVAIVQCMDGKASSAVLVCSLLLYAGMMERYEDALQMFAVKRLPPDLQPSETRYLQYLGLMLKNPPVLPHTQPVTLVSINLHPVPLFTKLRDGCRPYLEVYQGDERVKSTLTEYERMRVFHMAEGKVTMSLNVTVCGDVTVCVYHARQNLGGVMSSGRPTGHKICQLQFHTGFIQEEDTSLAFSRTELDDVGEADHYPDRFQVSVNVFVCDYSKELRPMPWESPRRVNPQMLFNTPLEMDDNYDNFVTKPPTPPKHMANPTAPPRPARPARPAPICNNVAPSLANENAPVLVDDVADADLLNIESSSVASEPVENLVNGQDNSNIDLLGLGFDSANSDAANSAAAAAAAAAATAGSTNGMGQKFGLDDLWQGSSSTGSAPAPQPVPQPAPQPTGDFFDPFGSEQPTQSTQNLYTWSGVTRPAAPAMPRNSSTPNLEQKNKDPFAEFGNLGASLNIPTSTSKPATPMGGSPNVQSPVHRPPSQTFGAFQQAGPVPQPVQQARTPGGTPIHQARSPDYSRSHFDTVNKKAGPAGVAVGSKPSGVGGGLDVFGDLLGSQGYDFASKKDAGPRTMNELRKEDLVKDMDPDRMKILEWTDGKKGNIRALLCSINMVLWEDCKWKGVEMSHLVTPADVKKAYRRACLAVHPDKQVGTDNENIAKLVFVELNNAWSDFENDASQQNLFAT